MSLHLVEIAQAVAPGAHGLVLLDQAGWHLSKRLVIPANITPVPLPAKATRRGSPTLIATRRPVFDWRRRTVMPS